MEAGTADPGKVIVDVTEGKLWAAFSWCRSHTTPRNVSPQAAESDLTTQLYLLLLGANRGYETVLSTCCLPYQTVMAWAHNPGHPREISRQGTRTYCWWILISSQNLRHTLTLITEVQCKTMASSGGLVRELAGDITRPRLQHEFKANLGNLVRIKIKTGRE